MANLASGRRDAPSAKLSSLCKAPKLKRVGRRALSLGNGAIAAGKLLNKRKARKRSFAKEGGGKRALSTVKERQISREETAAESA